MNTTTCPSKAKSWGANGVHLFLISIQGQEKRCFFCDAKEEVN